MAPEKHRFGYQPISCHTFNKARNELALSPNNHEVHLFKLSAGKWQLYDKLIEHVQRVTDVDWAANSDRIVSCGVDRNAYVWTRQAGGWKPTLVILRINRAATCVRWSPQENKIAVGSGARLIAICYFDQTGDWWIAKHVKKPIRSTVTCIDWHPSNYLIACGSTDFKARVFSAYVKEIESKPSALSWGTKMPFGNVMAEFSNGGGGWVHAVAFSSAGDKLAWVGHDSSISVVNSSNGNAMATIKTEYLPFMTLTWISENCILSAGHDCVPMIFEYDGNNIKFSTKLEKETTDDSEKTVSARDKFLKLDSQRTERNVTELKTTHQNTITQISIHSGAVGNVGKFCTTGNDGFLCSWDVKV
ncbi:DgyrCDS12758 [Dimorphilus gyrociliatus]|uniref:Actin-related protein 2/3 complex subunit n=1 Tax=Dimorphilus gyrociliatus TaxID=2664684 RepID=A0A7I8W8A8_9ANNE|nr:DgyrCDS12758 [Dimorphilus gyrociliatus]